MTSTIFPSKKSVRVCAKRICFRRSALVCSPALHLRIFRSHTPHAKAYRVHILLASMFVAVAVGSGSPFEYMQIFYSGTVANANKSRRFRRFLMSRPFAVVFVRIFHLSPRPMYQVAHYLGQCRHMFAPFGLVIVSRETLMAFI